MCRKGKKDPASVENYFRRLYSLVYDIGKLETPFIPMVGGRVYGSGISISGLSTFGLGNCNASARFPETSFGFIPNGGTSYLLSRMPAEIGVYLALTGEKLVGTDLSQLGLVYNNAEFNEYLLGNIESLINTQYDSYSSKIMHGDTWNELLQTLNTYETLESKKDSIEIANRLNLTSFWREQRENTKMTVADVYYNAALRRDSIASSSLINYKDFGGQKIFNHLKEFEEYVIEKNQLIPSEPLSIKSYGPAIYRVFSAKTLEEAIERLVYESHFGEKEWAKRTLSNLSGKSALSLEVTFHLVKNAYNLEWSESLQKEFKAAVNMSKHPDFHEGVAKVLSKRPALPIWTTKFPISRDQILEITENPIELNLNSKENELLPVKEYFRDFPQAPRFWVNEISPTLEIQRRDFEFEVRSFFNGYGIDLRDHNIEIPVVRSNLYYSLLKAKRIDEEMDRINRVSEDLLSIRIYIDLRIKEINNFINDKQEFQTTIQTLLNQHFQTKFLERYELIEQKCKDAHDIKKREFFKDLKDTLHKKLFIKSLSKGTDAINQLKEAKMSPVPISFPKDNNESYLPSLINAKYEYSTSDKNEYHVADILLPDDYISYYALETPRFSTKTDFQIDKAKIILSELYCAIDTINKQDSIEDSYENITSVKSYIRAKSQEYLKILNKTTKNDVEESSKGSEGIKNELCGLEKEIQNHLEDVNKFQNQARVNLITHEPVQNPRELKQNDELEDNLESTDLSGLDSDHESSDAELPNVPKGLSFEERSKLFGYDEISLSLFEDIYVKTGCENMEEGIIMMKSGNFQYNPEAIKKRRMEISTIKFHHDDKYYQPNNALGKMKKLFSDCFITPGVSDIDSKLLNLLEIENTKVLLHQLELAKESRLTRTEKPESDEDFSANIFKKLIEAINLDPNLEETKLDDVANSIKFDSEYLKVIFGDKVYIPRELENNKESAEDACKALGLYDYSLSPKEWLSKALKEVIRSEFDLREKEEATMTHSELLAYDQEFKEKFRPQSIKELLVKILNLETSVAIQAREMINESYRIKSAEKEEVLKPLHNLNDYSASNQEYLRLSAAHQLRDYVKEKIDRPPKKKISLNTLNVEDPYREVLEYEKKHNLIEEPSKDPIDYIKKFSPSEYSSVTERKMMNKGTKKNLASARAANIRTAKLIKSTEVLLKQTKYNRNLDSIEEFKALVEEHKEIL